MNRRDLIKTAVSLAVTAPFTPVNALIGMPGGGAAGAAFHDLIVNMGTSTGYADIEQPFLNVMHQAATNAPVYSAWGTKNASGADTNEEPYIYQILDANGYPKTLTLPSPPTGGQQFTKLYSGVFTNLAAVSGVANAYPSDTYRFQWQGKCTIVFTGDVKVLTDASAGCTISGLQVTSTNALGTVNSVILQGTGGTSASPVPLTPSAGINFYVTALPDSVNYLQAITCVQSTYTTLFDSGETFHPALIAALQTLPKIKALRFMDLFMMNSQVSHARYLGYSFASAPTAGSALPPLSAAWPGQSGQRRIVLATGEELQATFSTGSTTVTSTANPTITATTSTVPSGEQTTDYFWFAFDSWSQRAQLNDFTYATQRGIPIEIAIKLCNKLGCDLWLNVPPQFQASDWASLAALIKANLNAGLKCYVELSNEVWNLGSFNTGHLFNCQSQKLWGTASVGSYYGMTHALMADQFASTAGNPGFDNTFIFVMAGQAANTGWLTTELTTPSWTGNTPPWQRTSPSGQKTIKGVAIAPYFGNGAIPSADWTFLSGQADGGYTYFFDMLTANPVGGHTFTSDGTNALPSGGWFALAASYVTNTISAIASYGALPVYCYEGSWQFDDQNNAAGQEAFQAAAAIDSRMANLQQLYYRQIAAAGATPCQYSFCYAYKNGFTWGLIQSPFQTLSPLSSAPPRLQGAVNYINNG